MIFPLIKQVLQKARIFFIKVKFLTNEELVRLYKKSNNIDASNELVRRFTIASRKEAGALKRIFWDVTTAEYDDLVSIGLTSLMVALENYNYKGSFYVYWQVIAKHNMKEHVKENSLSISGFKTYIGRQEGLTSYEEEMIIACNYKLDKISVDMFRKHYFFEESINEIATKYEKKYHTVRNRIEKIKEKIIFILFNSKE